MTKMLNRQPIRALTAATCAMWAGEALRWRRSGLALTFAFTFVITSAFAFAPVQGNEAAACSDQSGAAQSTTSNGQPAAQAPAVAHLATPSEKALGSDWPVVSQTEETRYDSKGRPYRAVTTVREQPLKASSTSGGLPIGPRIASACSSALGDISPTMTAYSYDGAFAQNYTLFFHRYLNDSGQYTAYQNYQTNVWWWRNSSDHDVYQNQAQNCWHMPWGFDCRDASVLNNDVCSQLPFSATINWPSGTGNTDVYTYLGPMNTWPFMYRTSTGGSMNWSFPMTTQWAVGGTYIGTISDSYTTPFP